ncbi:helix-turn-helix transcriptional regulator [Iamia sp. SCSIO 61187]|uniref:helix-turn-helix domain-containing protein n=1 Tax=Iamia sp. SCSIO 61187 TaxID=2722752 RepID=UPI001C633604|nr:helix-turn-helix transcriptional regulator [Iamia sp. SCSIO 61187]
MDTTEALERGRTAFGARAWPEAYAALHDADRVDPLGPVDLERVATAAYLTGHDTESTDAWARAHQGWRAQGDPRRAVRCAFWLGFALVQRGDMAQGRGWLARAGRMVDEHRLDTVERGYLLVPAGLAAMGAGEPDTALERFAGADSLARRFGDPDLAALGLLGQGEVLLRLGRTDEGLGLFDEAMVSVTSGETSPVISGLVYCAVIDACQRVFDLRRAREWTAALDRWCDHQTGLVPYRGQCLVHRAQVLQLRGGLGRSRRPGRGGSPAAERSAAPRRGHGALPARRPAPPAGRAARGRRRVPAAHAAGRDPQPGLSLLLLAEGRVDAAAAAIDAALDSAVDPVDRTRLLPSVVEILLAAGRPADAQVAVDELDQLAASSGATMLRAVAGQARGALLVTRGAAAAAALAPLHEALVAWQRLEAPFEVAQVRMLLAAACRHLDDREGAARECQVARGAFEELGARTALAQLDRLLSDEVPAPVEPPGSAEDRRVVTDREVEVLRLVAAGRTNRQIAGELSISERTVERHLGNIFTKLDVANRAAATAWASDHGLLARPRPLRGRRRWGFPPMPVRPNLADPPDVAPVASCVRSSRRPEEDR